MLAKLAEGAERGFLGSLKGAAGEWEKVVKAYEYNRAYNLIVWLLLLALD